MSTRRQTSSAVFRDRNEFERRHHAPSRALAAEQRFEAGDGIQLQIDLRLIDQRELANASARRRDDYEISSVLHLLVHRLLEQAIGSASVITSIIASSCSCNLLLCGIVIMSAFIQRSG
jgi:hypothetical protein